MKMKKKDITEIIDGDGKLIGTNDIPDVDANADTQAKNTSDYNQKVGTQPFRYDMLGRFGFTMMPFMEGEDKQQGQIDLEDELIELMHQRYIDLVSHYFRGPKRIKSDYRKHVTDGEISAETEKYNKEWANKILKVIEKHFEEPFKNLDEHYQENLAESTVREDRMVSKKEDEMTNKTDDGGVREKKLEKIAGLINKLEKKDIDKLINLLEKNG